MNAEQARLGEVCRALGLAPGFAEPPSHLDEEPRRRRLALHGLRAQPLAASGDELLQRLGTLALGLLGRAPLRGDQRRLVADQRPETGPHPASVQLLLIGQLDPGPGTDPQRTPGKAFRVAHFQEGEERGDRHVERRAVAEQRHGRDRERSVAASRAVLGGRNAILDRAPFHPRRAEIDRPAQVARGVRLHRPPDRRGSRSGLDGLLFRGQAGSGCRRVAARTGGEHQGHDGDCARQEQCSSTACVPAARAGRKEDEVGRGKADRVFSRCSSRPPWGSPPRPRSASSAACGRCRCAGRAR